jgi:hypothetical protein
VRKAPPVHANIVEKTRARVANFHVIAIDTHERSMTVLVHNRGMY